MSPQLTRRDVLRIGAGAAGAAASSALLSACGLGGDAGTPSGGDGELVFLSTQLATTEEAEMLRRRILAGSDQKATLVPASSSTQFIDRVVAESKAGATNVGVLGGLQGDFVTLADRGLLRDMGDVVGQLADREFTQKYLDLAKVQGTYAFVPWIQATYIMAARKEALEHLPAGADVNSLTYDQLLAWLRAIQQATGRKRFGLPAGPDGLVKRFVQGYLYPSFTGGVVTTFTGPDAVAGWTWLREAWGTASPQSVNYAFMQEPLLSGEVWVAWDHAVRLVNALKTRPDGFVTFPAPSGPKGRGFLPVLGGLSIPKNAGDVDAAKKLISYLTRPETAATMLEEAAWFPPLDLAGLPSDLPAPIAAEARTIQAVSTAPDAVAALLPVGLGSQGGAYDKVFVDSFQAIILNNQDIASTLRAQGQQLQKVLTAADAPCWAPDPAGEGACRVG